MTGLVGYNRHNFNKAAEYLRKAGHEVRNPACLDQDWTSYEDYIEVGLTMLRQCDAIVVLPGWEDSKGVAMEVEVAKQSNMVFFSELIDPIIDELQPQRLGRRRVSNGSPVHDNAEFISECGTCYYRNVTALGYEYAYASGCKSKWRHNNGRPIHPYRVY